MRFRSATPALSLLLALALSPALQASDVALPRGVERVTSVEGITEYRLQNGLRVLLFPDASKPTVTVNITYLVGSRHENYGETGMAHLLEHLLFKGTPTHADIPGEFRRRGISYNGTTNVDRTNYFGSFAAGADNLEWLLRLEADRMVNSLVSRKDLDSEMTVVRNEMESGENDPWRVLIGRMNATAYLWHNYGKSTIGARADVENMPIERLQAFYRSYYRPDNATLLIAGRIDPAKALAATAATFGPVKRPAGPLPVTYTAEPTQDGEREVVIRRVGDTRLVGLSYHLPAAAHPDSAALSVLGEVLGHTPGGRLHKALVEPGLATGSSAGAWRQAEAGSFKVLVQLPRDGDDEALADVMLATVEQLADTPITEDEVTRGRDRLLKSIELLFNDANRTATALSEVIAAGDWRLFFLRRDQLEKVTLADVERVAAAYLKPSNRTLARFIPTEAPDRAEIPAAPDVAALVEGYTGREAVSAGEAFDPTPANIESRTLRDTLANGTGVVMLPKETRGDSVQLSISFRFGREAEIMDRSAAAELGASLLIRGTQTLSREQVSQRLDELKARISINGGTQGVGVGANTTRENLPALLALVADLLKAPAFPEAEFEQLKQQSLAWIDTGMSDPQRLAGNAYRRHFNGHWPKGHPFYAGTFEENRALTSAATLDQVRAFHREFYGAGFGEIALVGDFDPVEAKALLEQHFGGWTTPRPYERIADPMRTVPPVSLAIETPDKANAIALMGTLLPMGDEHPDYPAMVVANNVFGGAGLKSRLGERLRGKEGLSYSAGARFSADVEEDRATHDLFAIAAPENITRVREGFEEELARLVRDGVTEEEVKDAVDGLLKSRVLNRAEDGNLVGLLRSNLYYGRTLAWSAAFEEKLQALTKADVDAAIRRHIDPATYALVTAGDFAKAAGDTAP